MGKMLAGDLVVDGSTLKEMLALGKYLAAESQKEYEKEIRSIIDVGIIVENQLDRSSLIPKDVGYYVFVHWPDGDMSPKHTSDLVKIENLDKFIQKNLSLSF